eukprot:6787400-Pyramimonas_sp.AAC.1
MRRLGPSWSFGMRKLAHAQNARFPKGNLAILASWGSVRKAWRAVSRDLGGLLGRVGGLSIAPAPFRASPGVFRK